MADDNKPLKYMRYAIGEIVLVVIGILIALQINNWNEQRKERQKEASFLIKLKDEIESNIIYLTNRDSLATLREFNSEKAIELFYRAKTIKDILVVDSLFEISWNDLRINKNTFDEMLNTGSIYTLKNEKLGKKISEHYSYVESRKYTFREINNQSTELYRSPSISPYSLLTEKVSKNGIHINELDVSWIGDVNSPTFLALYKFFTISQSDCNIWKRRQYEDLLTRSNDLVNEIEMEISESNFNNMAYEKH